MQGLPRCKLLKVFLELTEEPYSYQQSPFSCAKFQITYLLSKDLRVGNAHYLILDNRG